MSFNNKRRRDDEGDEEFPPHERQRHFVKKPRQELSQELQLAIKLCEDITKLGEKNLKSFNNDINYMSFPISEEINESLEIRNAVLKTFYAVITEQPHKLQFIGALLKICNLRNPLVGKYVFEFLHQKSQELLDNLTKKDHDEDETSGGLNKLKLVLRFFAINRRLIVKDGVYKIFEQFLQTALDLQEHDMRLGVAEALYYNVLISIPYLKFHDEDPQNVTQLIELARRFNIVRIESSMYEHFDNSIVRFDKPYEAKSLVELILPALEASDCECTYFIDFDELIAPLIAELGIEEANATTTGHVLPQFAVQLELLRTVELRGYVDSLWKNPRMVLEVYLSSTHEFETKPSIQTYFGLLLNDICEDIIQNMEFNKTSVSQQLLLLDSFFKQTTFAKPGSSIDKLTILNDKKAGTVLEVDPNDPASFKIAKLVEEVDADFAEGFTSTWKIEDILTESILNLIFNLPEVSNPIIFFYTVLVECCSKESKAMAPVFGRAIRFFFTNITILDFELRSRYLDWLAVQLSNFRFQWKWHEWTEFIVKYGALRFNPIMIFIKNLIAKEIRLSSVKKIKETLPEEFYQYLDISLNDAAYIENYDTEVLGKPYWPADKELELKFTHEANGDPLAAQVFAALSENDTSVEEFGALIAQYQEEEDRDDRCIVNLIFQSSCIIGSRSISHIKFHIENRAPLFKHVLDSLQSDAELKRQWVIESVLRVWNHEPQIGYLILEMLLMSELISGKQYLQSLFRDDAVLLNISSIESLLRVLSNTGLYHIDETLIFVELYDLIQAELIGVVTALGEDEISVGEEELNDEKWKYAELLKLLKSILRKYNKSYKQIDPQIRIEHLQTKAIVQSYFKDLSQMN